MMPRIRWTPEEEARLIDLIAAGKSWTFISAALKRDMNSVKLHAKALSGLAQKRIRTEMKAKLQELEDRAAELQATARQLPSGPDRHDLLQEVGKFRAQVSAMLASRRPTRR